MLYASTRGVLKSLTFKEVLFSGYLPDYGLAFPEEIPKITLQELREWKNYSYPEIVAKLLQLYISEDEIPATKINEITSIAFKKFDKSEIIPLHFLHPETLAIAEMFHGPTNSFKDLALLVIRHLMLYFLEQDNKHITILVGTSGDTGSAAIECARDSTLMDIIVLYPKDACVPFQERQMTTVLDSNVHCIAVEGSSDDLDVPIQKCFKDVEFSKFHNLCSINSINWARIMVQIAHYFYVYLKMSEPNDKDSIVEVIVPTGACGNITAGLIAQEMGLPINIVCTVNKNDVLYRAQTTGEFIPSQFSYHTLAVSMDIQMPYNFERIIYLLTQGDTDLINKFMSNLEASKSFILPTTLRSKLRSRMPVYSTSDEIILSSISKCWKNYSYHVCPHTATAVAYCFAQEKQYDKKKFPMVVLATASPAKFPDAFERVDVPPVSSPYLESLGQLATKKQWMRVKEDWLKILKDKIEEISKNINSI